MRDKTEQKHIKKGINLEDILNLYMYLERITKWKQETKERYLNKHITERHIFYGLYIDL